MAEDIYEPLSEYRDVFSPRFKDVAEKTFAELAEEARVDVEANRETCRQIYSEEAKLESLESSISGWKFLRGLLWFAIAVGIIILIFNGGQMESNQAIALTGGIFCTFVIILMVIFPKLESKRQEHDSLSAKIEELKSIAWGQMEPLNRLYDWDVFTHMMTRTVPKLEFDPYFTTQRLADLKKTYGWDGSFNAGRSVIYSHSGLINGNPFVICRTKKMEMGTKTYTGSKTISWTTQERGADGKCYTAYHSETLTAQVTAPYPNYYEKTRLIYGNTSAPDLVFTRSKSNLAGAEGTHLYRKTRRQLRKKANNLLEADYAMMTNEEFEVAFDTRDRNNNQQFALLFTPLAQENMLNLLKDRIVGYGDDFDFNKDRMINTIIPDHLQSLNLDMNPDQFRDFDYDKAEKEFHEINAKYFRAIYFSLAPLLCVPIYQQIRPIEAIYGRDMQKQSSFWEHESLANFWGVDKFKHPSCVTDCILKTEQSKGRNGKTTIKVSALGYRAVKRVTNVGVWGGDGKYHQVPVYWDEYLSVTGTGNISIKEDENFEDLELTQHERLDHISTVLTTSDLSVYRRHIASKV
ncbi:MAG: hypothetical protein MJY72_08670 [Bacteroidales bacterium]|nr:hypothetical protein [Bacteroidales bacterium]